ncbi:MAG TPA: hypothetical protein VK207_09010 [Bacteroidales bacterium]|nr:hypothetical protein [Bacteroidales bacterium]
MEKTNKSSFEDLRGTYNLIARKVGCSRKYVYRVLEGRLGKYSNRETALVKKIREMAERLEAL